MILVTGATGFLGSELAAQLARQGANLVCIKRGTSAIPNLLIPYQNQIKWVEADILNYYDLAEALQGIEQVYHCAALISFNPADNKRMIKTNVEGTANVVNSCIQHNIRLLHVSSVVAVGEAKPGQLTNENTFLEGTPAENGYAISKYESEMEVWRGIAEGLDAVIVNPSIIIGANSGKMGSGKLFDMVHNGLQYYPRGSFGFVDVADVAKSMIVLMNSGIKGERFIVNAENRSFKNLFNQIAKNLVVKPPRTEARPWMLGMAWRASSFLSALSGKSVGIDKISAQAASKTVNYDNSKVTQATGIQFKPLDQSIAEVCKALFGS